MPPSEHEQERIERLRRAMYSRGLSDKLKERPRHELDEGKAPVGEDWVAPEPKIAGVSVTPRALDLTRTALKWLLMAAIAFFVVAVGFFVYFFTLGGGSHPASPNNIDITVTGPPTIAGGEVSKLQVVIVNRNKVALELADLVVTFPQGTRSPTDFATDLPSQRIPLGTIEPGGQRQGTVPAVYSGASASEANVVVSLEYRVAGSNAIFVAKRDYAIAFRTSPLDISIDGNTETVSGQPVQFTVNVVSNATAPQKDVVLRVEYPFGFTFSAATPAASAPNMWYLGDFSPGEVKSVQISGTVRGEPGDARIFRLSAGTRKSPTSTSIDTKLADNSHPVRVSQSFLGLVVNINSGSASAAGDPFGSSIPVQTGAVVGPGEVVAVSISYENNLSSPITDAIIVARLSGVPIDGSTVRSNDGFYRSSDGIVLWDKTTTQGKLGTIAAGGKGTVSFTFKAPEGATVGGSASVDISVNAAGKRLSETNVPQNLQSAVVKKVQIASDIRLFAQGYYYQNPFTQFREGPMPPIAQQETTYGIVFAVTNTTSRITKARLTAHLPSYVRWMGNYYPVSEDIYIDGRIFRNQQFQNPPAGDPCQGVSGVCWSIGDIEPGVGIGGTEPLKSAILIGFTPSTSQVGQVPPLVEDITLTGIDSATGQPITCDNGRACTVKDVTTNITGDEGFDPGDATVK